MAATNKKPQIHKRTAPLYLSASMETTDFLSRLTIVILNAVKNPRMRVNNKILGANRPVCLAQPFGAGAHPGMFRFAQHDNF